MDEYRQRRWATLKQAASYCGLSERTLYTAIREEHILSSLVQRSNRARGTRLVDLKSLDCWIEAGIGQMGARPLIRPQKEAEA